jgi:hypothetical protein
MRSLEGIANAKEQGALVSVRTPSKAMETALEEKKTGMKFDDDKPDWSLLDLNILDDTVKVLTFGAKKYARDNWQKVENGEQRYYAALIRHLNAHRSGEKLDPESGLPHMAHAMCCLTFLSYLSQNE